MTVLWKLDDSCAAVYCVGVHKPECAVGTDVSRPNVANHCAGILSLHVVKAINEGISRSIPHSYCWHSEGQYLLPSGPEETGAIIAELVKVEQLYDPTYSSFNSAV